MKKSIFLILFSFIAVFGFSQTNKLISFNENNISSNIVLINNNYYTGTNSGISTPRGMRIIKLNNLGDTIIVKNIKNDTIAISVNEHNFTKKNDKLIACNNISIPSKNYIGITCFNENLDTIWSNIPYQDSLLITVRNIINTSDNGFAICGTVGDINNSYNAFLLKTDSIGNKEWIKFYGYTNNEQFTGVVQTQDNSFILSGDSYKYNVSFSDWYIVRTDSLGNQIWDWVLRNPEYDVPNIENLDDGPIADLIQTQDGNFIAVGAKCYTNSYISSFWLSNARLLKFDINKNILLDTLYYRKYENNGVNDSSYSAFNKIKQKPNGNFLVLNNHQSMSGDNPFKVSNLYELNNNFDIIINREYRATSYGNNNENLKDFLIETDGSVAMIGDIQLNTYHYPTSPSQRVWFIKTDNNYCDGFGSCDTNFSINFITDSVRKDTAQYIKFEIISNVNMQYNIDFTYYHKNYERIAKDTVYNIFANTTDSIDISYKWLNNQNEHPNNIVSDTVYIKYQITPIDSVFHMQLYSLISPNYVIFYQPDTTESIAQIHKPKPTIRVYPNPVRDCVNFDLNDIQDYLDNDVLIYDVSGREVKRCVINNSELKIKVGDLPNGIYFVQVGSDVAKFVKNCL